MEKGLNVFMTGATGHMGREALKLLAADQNVNLKLLVLGNKADKEILKPYRSKENVEIILGDLRDLKSIRKGIEGTDFVLHIGAMIPPAADYYPQIAEQVNYGGTLNIIEAIKEQKNPENIRFIYVSTVASLGNRPAPIHWGRVGDPIKISKFDAYAASKVKAERAVIESGLKFWVSLRQSGMLHRDLAKIMEPIIYHQPINNHIEWSTAEDSGRALYNICTENLPEGFWRNIYNIGSGPDFRMTNYEFMKHMFEKMGMGDFRKFLKPRDFATQNFHCVWYSDSDRLEEWLHFRKSSLIEFLNSLDIPYYYRFAGLLPARVMRKYIFEPLARRREGTLHWIENNVAEKIRAFWGSRDNWEKIPESWEKFIVQKNPLKKLIHHGYNEKKKPENTVLRDCLEAARFRGGFCRSSHMDKGDLYTPLQWECAFGHKFEASPNLIFRGGHWCPRCDLDVDNYGRAAEKNPFFAQVF